MSRTHITEAEPYEMSINEVIAYKLEVKKHKKEAFDIIMCRLLKQEGINDDGAIKCKKYRYKKHYENNNTSIGILLNMLVNEMCKNTPKTELEIKVSQQLKWNHSYHRFNDDYNKEAQKVKRLENEIKVLHNEIKYLKRQQ